MEADSSNKLGSLKQLHIKTWGCHCHALCISGASQAQGQNHVNTNRCFQKDTFKGSTLWGNSLLIEMWLYIESMGSIPWIVMLTWRKTLNNSLWADIFFSLDVICRIWLKCSLKYFVSKRPYGKAVIVSFFYVKKEKKLMSNDWGDGLNIKDSLRLITDW